MQNGQIADKNIQAKTYVNFIIDKSGSMAGIRHEARTTFNEQIQVIQKKSQDQEVVASVTIFNGEVEHPIWCQDIGKCKELTKDEYQPNGSTAMFDAIGMCIDKLKSECNDLDENRVSVLFIVVSDGQENSSRGRNDGLGNHISYGTRNDPTPIQQKIKEQQDTGRWTFTFLAANVNIMELAKTMGVAAGNTRSFDASKGGMIRASGEVSGALGTYLDSRSQYGAEIATRGVASAASMSSDKFFSEVVEDKNKESK